MADRSQDPGSAPLAEELFAGWLAAGDGRPDFDVLCRDHPEHADALRGLHEHWRVAQDVIARAGFGIAPGQERSFAERLRERYGPEVDPDLSLEERDEGREDLPSSALLERLAEHTLERSRYRFQGEIDRGGMGVIFKVWDDDLRRSLAMKVVYEKGESPAEGDTPPVGKRTLARFLEEAQITGQLDHPGIVPVHELGLDSDGRVYFTMKLVKGRDLKAIFDLVFDGREGWNETRALGVILKVCEAMAYAHAKGVIHRDLKPANVMVGSFGEVYVMDWGLARVQGREDAHDLRLAPEEQTSTSLRTERLEERMEAPDSPLFTMDGDIVGTPVYMPPEQARGEVEKLSPRSDVYAIGAMLYHLLARQMPYVPPGARLTKRLVLARVVAGPPEPLASIRRDVPAELVAICERSMSRAPELRYRDTLELAEDLRAYLEHRVVKAHQTGAVAELHKWIERNKGLAASIAGAFLLLIAGLSASLIFKARSDRNADLAQKHAEDVLRLSALQKLDDLTAEADRLWPARPELVGSYEDWLDRAQGLVDELPLHEEKLAELRAKAEGPEWTFAEAEDKWWHSQLQKLVEGLKAFSDPERGLLSSGISPEHGWGVRRRLELAQTIEERSVRGAEASARWSEAIASIASLAECPEYGGLHLAPQVGLLPVGRDPDSGLWEFAHLLTGEPAKRGPDGKLVLKPETGIVFVLLPGGTFWMGAQSTDPDGPGYDPQAKPDESPRQRVTLSPFFLSKYEMTQGQWMATMGGNPSYHSADNYESEWNADHRPWTALHPVEQVSWNDCTEVLGRLGLDLPTEAQWEYGARAGTTTVWWTGDDKESLVGMVNIADRHAREHGGEGWSTRHELWFDDGNTVHAEVGTYPANAFGLHEVIANLWEWCRDGYGSYGTEVRPGDGERLVDDLRYRVNRGGGYYSPVAISRSALRSKDEPEFRDADVGLRPARSLSTP